MVVDHISWILVWSCIIGFVLTSPHEHTLIRGAGTINSLVHRYILHKREILWDSFCALLNLCIIIWMAMYGNAI